MNAENRQHHGPQRESQTEMQIFLLQREFRVVSRLSAVAQSPFIFGTQNLELDILPKNQVLSIPNRFQIPKEPIIHKDKDGKPTSHSKYLINLLKTPDGRHRICLATLDANSTTSKHSHPIDPPIIEHYFLLYGKASNDGVPIGKRHVVHPGNEHQITTGDDPALLLIFIENGGLVSEDMLHIPSRG